MRNNTKYFYFLILTLRLKHLLNRSCKYVWQIWLSFTIMKRFQDCGRMTLRVMQLMCCWCIKTDSCISWLFGACCQTPSGFFSTWKSSHLSYMNHFLPAALNQTAALRFPGFTFWALSKNPVCMKLQQVWKFDSLFYSHCCTNLIWHVWVKTPSLNCKMPQTWASS